MVQGAYVECLSEQVIQGLDSQKRGELIALAVKQHESSAIKC